MKKNMKTLLSSLILTTATIIPICPTDVGIAKSQNNKQYEVFNKLKLNATINDSATIIYGKEAENKICDSTEDEVKINVLCRESMWSSNEFYKNGKLRYLNYSFYLYPEDKKSSDPGEFTSGRMVLVFKSKENSKDLHLVEKTWSTLSNENTHKVYDSKKIKKGMTKNQLDSIMTGKGVGPHESVTYTDYSKVGYQDGASKPNYSKPSKIYSYSITNQKNNKHYYFEMKYNKSKKSNTVSYGEISTVRN
ncbi:hypothetical protein [Exiguobacterium sp. s192]|uniref:hypothetical protein n=1 Tax=Exiguobacterium sp. s192 TaxID=2751206 RepID=UPI001BE85592|nr:hypothetical protein [Exiguobacterium sp. s192]